MVSVIVLLFLNCIFVVCYVSGTCIRNISYTKDSYLRHVNGEYMSRPLEKVRIKQIEREGGRTCVLLTTSMLLLYISRLTTDCQFRRRSLMSVCVVRRLQRKAEKTVAATVLYCVAYVTSQQGSYRSSSSAVLAHTGHK
jgi:hypothetical protein